MTCTPMLLEDEVQPVEEAPLEAPCCSAPEATAQVDERVAMELPAAAQPPARQAMVELARSMGWRLIRLSGKTPLDKGWTKSAGLTESEILEHQGNLGIVCGEPSGRLLVVDIDGERPDGLPETPTVSTGGGGFHLYYRLPEGVSLVKANKVGHVAPGVDIRWTGGQVVAPGSVHPDTGKLYVWLPDLSPLDIPLADVPAWVVEKLQESRTKPRQDPDVEPSPDSNSSPAEDPTAATLSPEAASELQAAADTVRNAPEGERNSTLNTKAYALGGLSELSDELITETLLEAALEAGLPEQEARKTIASGIAAGRKSPRKGLQALIPLTEEYTATPLVSLEEFKASRCTDVANGERFEKKFAGKVIHSDSLGWLVWDGKRFARDYKGARECAKTIADDIRSEILSMAQKLAPGDHQAVTLFQQCADALNSWAKASSNTRGVDNILTEARTTPGINGNALEFDANPWLLNCQNGTVDLRKGVLMPHNPRHLITKLIPIAYDADARCPRWDLFLKEVFQDDQKLIEYVRRALGYSLSGDTSWQVWFLLHGSGANGKSCFVDVLRQVLGSDYSHEIDPEDLCQQPWGKHTTERAALMGVRYLTSEETDEGRQLAEAFVKALTGGGKIRARFMRQDSFEFEPRCKLWLSTNNRPIVRDNSHGFWRRVRLIPFLANFSQYTKCDPKLGEKLTAEAPGILAQLVHYATVAYRKGEGPVPKCISQARERYRNDSDTLGQFLAEHTTDEFPQERLMKQHLYTAYLTATGGKCESMTRFNARLKARGLRDTHTRHGAAWLGLKLRSPESEGADGENAA